MTTNSASVVVKWRRMVAVDAHLIKYLVVVLVTFFGRVGLVVGQDENTSSFPTTTVYQQQPEGGGTTTEQTVITEDVSSHESHVGVSGGDRGTAPNIYRGQSVQSVLSSFGVRGGSNGAAVLGGLQQQYYPTVNKCCPFFSRYEAGECVQAQPNSSRMMTMMPNQPFWEAPKAMVTLLSKDLDGMEISNDTVVFRWVMQKERKGKWYKILYVYFKYIWNSLEIGTKSNLDLFCNTTDLFGENVE